MTMTLVSTTTIGSGGAANIDFTSIPQTGTDLLLVLSGRSTLSGTFQDNAQIDLNGSTTGYTYKDLYGNGSATGSYTDSGNVRASIGILSAATSTANSFGNIQVYFPNYAGSTNKSFSVDAVQEDNSGTARQDINAGLWSNTAAISRITIRAFGANLAQYTTASLYTITKGSGGATVS